MKQFNKKTGQRGEDIASEYLREKGYEILKRNYSNKFGELDIIAKQGDATIFVEVKAKIGIDFGLPEEEVGKGKLNKIRAMATVYLDGRSVPCRIDVVAVVFNPDMSIGRISHYENVY